MPLRYSELFNGLLAFSLLGGLTSYFGGAYSIGDLSVLGIGFLVLTFIYIGVGIIHIMNFFKSEAAEGKRASLWDPDKVSKWKLY